MLPGTILGPAVFATLARRYWLALIGIPAVTFFAALLYSSTVADLYQSEMLIAIDPQRVPEIFVRSTVTLETDRRMDAIAVQVLSRTAMQGLVEQFGLYAEQRAKTPLEDVLAKMHDDVTIQLERPRAGRAASNEPSAFHVRFVYTDPEIAAKVTQEIGNLFVDQNRSERNAQADATNRFLESQLAEARRRLESQEQRLETFRRQHGPELPTQMQTNLQGIQSKQMQVQSLVESAARDRDRKLMLERLYREAQNDPVVAVRVPSDLATTPGATTIQRLEAARSALAALNQKYRPEHPDVLRAENQVALLESEAAREKATNPPAAGADSTPTATGDPVRREQLRTMRAELESLERQVAFKESEEQRLRAEIAEYQRRVEAVPGLESEWVAITRDYETQQRAYEELLAKSNAAQVSKELETQQIGETFRIVDPARVPVRPLTSQRVIYNAAGLAVGLVLAISLIAFLQLRDSTFRTETEILETLGIPVAASIPRVWTDAEIAGAKARLLAFSTMGGLCVVGALYLTWTLRLWKSLV